MQWIPWSVLNCDHHRNRAFHCAVRNTQQFGVKATPTDDCPVILQTRGAGMSRDHILHVTAADIQGQFNGEIRESGCYVM